jgi:NADPH:quinone reductase-like Zn-dependent oxidoreductase
MKAIIYTNYGSADNLQLQDVPKPIPKDNEVLIKVRASSINSWDWDMLRGKPFITRVIGGLFKPKHKILGADVAGTVAETGKHVKDFKIGDEVYGDIAGVGFGCFAEYVSAPENLLALKATEMSFEQAAALPQAGFLALQGLRFKTTLKQGDTLLINGAGGSVGTLALQYAKSLGVEVTCVDHADKLERLRSLGADYVIDFQKVDYTDTGIQYDYILDAVADRSISAYKRALKPGGTFSMIGGSTGLLLRLMLTGWLYKAVSGKTLGIMGYRPNRIDLEELNTLFDNGTVIPVIDSAYPLQNTSDAFRHFGSAKFFGKIVINDFA